MTLIRFFMGGLTAGLFAAAIFIFLAPLIPGEAPVTGSATLRTEPEGADATRHFLPGGTSIAIPLDWPLIPGASLYRFDKFGLAARAGPDSRILLAAADTPTAEEATGILIVADTGGTGAAPVNQMQAYMDRIRPKLARATVIHEARPAFVAGLPGATAGFRAEQEGRIGRRTMNARLNLLRAVPDSVLVITIGAIGTGAPGLLEEVLASLRVE